LRDRPGAKAWRNSAKEEGMSTENTNRRHARAPLDLYINKIVGDEPRLVRTRDISESGLYLFKLLEPELEGEFVGLEMKLPNAEDVIWAVGQIVREERPDDGLAIRFVRMTAADRKIISEYIATAPARATAAA
jgi:hypothetical protein